MTQVVLASASPRRQMLLKQINLDFICHPSGIEEKPVGSSPEEIAASLALQKASEVAGQFPGKVVIGADTLVVCDGKILGKPRDANEAKEMLELLSGNSHEVVTGVALVCREKRTNYLGMKLPSELVDTERTSVYFRPLSPAEINNYIASGEPMDKAGAYGIQALGSTLVYRVEGCFYNVVGLPLAKLAEMLRDFGIYIL